MMFVMTGGFLYIFFKKYCFKSVLPFNLEIWSWQTGWRDKLVKGDPPAPSGPDVEQSDIIPPVSPRTAQWLELLMLHDQTHLGWQHLQLYWHQVAVILYFPRRGASSGCSRHDNLMVLIQTIDCLMTDGYDYCH